MPTGQRSRQPWSRSPRRGKQPASRPAGASYRTASRRPSTPTSTTHRSGRRSPVSVFETFYEKDWGQEARAARDERHRVLASVHGIGVVVKGTVDHRVFGRGYEVFRFSRVNEADIRVTPNGVRIQKLS